MRIPEDEGHLVEARQQLPIPVGFERLIPPMGPEGAAVATTVAMVAGAVTWLAGQHLLKRVTPLVAVLVLSTAAACVATLAEAARIEIAAGTLVAGAWLLVAGGAKGVKRLLAERWASP